MTLTLSPALDLCSTVETIEPWRKLRCEPVQVYPGGGGINVARVIRQLDGEPVAVVALGGHFGSQFADSVRAQGLDLRRVGVRSATRQNYLVTERSSGRQFRFVHPAGRLTRGEWLRCLEATIDAARRGAPDGRGAALVVASSSLPAGVPVDAFAVLAHRLAELGVPLIVDTSGPALLAAIGAPVLLVKPSVNELGALVGARLSDDGEIETAARRLLADGAAQVMVVSMAGRGALVVPRDAGAFVVAAPAVQVASTSGAGDSMVAGFAVALADGAPLAEAARLGVAAGTASVLVPGTALCRRTDVDRLLPMVTSMPTTSRP